MAAGWISASGLRTAAAAAGPPKRAAEHLGQRAAGLRFSHADDRQGRQVPDAQQAAHELPQEQVDADEDVRRSKKAISQLTCKSCKTRMFSTEA